MSYYLFMEQPFVEKKYILTELYRITVFAIFGIWVLALFAFNTILQLNV